MPARGDPARACGVVEELILRALEGDTLGDVVASALLAGDAVELTELLARIGEETGRGDTSRWN
jgi:hypothetical protein